MAQLSDVHNQFHTTHLPRKRSVACVGVGNSGNVQVGETLLKQEREGKRRAMEDQENVVDEEEVVFAVMESMRLFFQPFPQGSVQVLYEFFAQFGPIHRLKRIVLEGEDGTNEAVGMVKYFTKRALTMALQNPEMSLNGKTIRIRPAKATQEYLYDNTPLRSAKCMQFLNYYVGFERWNCEITKFTFHRVEGEETNIIYVHFMVSIAFPYANLQVEGTGYGKFKDEKNRLDKQRSIKLESPTFLAIVKDQTRVLQNNDMGNAMKTALNAARADAFRKLKVRLQYMSTGRCNSIVELL